MGKTGPPGKCIAILPVPFLAAPDIPYPVYRTYTHGLVNMEDQKYQAGYLYTLRIKYSRGPSVAGHDL